MSSLEGVAESYEQFFQPHVPAERRALQGLHGWLRDRFPLRRPDGLLTLEYVGYRMDEPPFGLKMCQDLNCDFRAPFWLTLRLARWSPRGPIDEVFEQDVGVGAMPALTAAGAVYLPELQPRCWRDVEAAIIEEMTAALSHAERHLAEVAIGGAREPWAIVHGQR